MVFIWKTSSMNKKVAILQSNYIPWKGYFDLIASVDEFIIYDDAQYTKNDWRNRNIIKNATGVQWLSIPVFNKSLDQTILETQVANKNWTRKHWNTIKQNYSKSKYFEEYSTIFEDLYLNCKDCSLSLINYKFILVINDILGIKTKISWSSDYTLLDGKSERLVGLCKDSNANEYISGPAAKGYLDESLFEDNGIKVTWFDYSGYPEYEQRFPPFIHGVTILDLIFNEGPDANKYMRFYNET